MENETQPMTPERRAEIEARIHDMDELNEMDLNHPVNERLVGVLVKDRYDLFEELTRRDEVEAALRSQADGLAAALGPFADAVFNDNGDMTVSMSRPSYDDYCNAYFARKKYLATYDSGKEGK